MCCFKSLVDLQISILNRKKNCLVWSSLSSKVLIFCDDFQELSYLTHGSSREENKCWYKLSKCIRWHLFNSKWSNLSFWVKIIAQLVTFSSQLEISEVLNGTTPKFNTKNDDRRSNKCTSKRYRLETSVQIFYLQIPRP